MATTLQIKRENGKIFCPLTNSWHIETPEEKVRQEYIKILVENYSYSLDQMAQELKVTNSQRGQGKARADIVVWKTLPRLHLLLLNVKRRTSAFVKRTTIRDITMLLGPEQVSLLQPTKKKQSTLTWIKTISPKNW